MVATSVETNRASRWHLLAGNASSIGGSAVRVLESSIARGRAVRRARRANDLPIRTRVRVRRACTWFYRLVKESWGKRRKGGQIWPCRFWVGNFGLRTTPSLSRRPSLRSSGRVVIFLGGRRSVILSVGWLALPGTEGDSP